MNSAEPLAHSNIRAYIPMLEAVVSLFYPYVEGAIHDLQHGKVIALYNNISKRSIGDPSAVTELGVDPKNFPDVFEPYYKTNWDGKKLKCVSVTVRDESNTPIGLICINFDTSVFQEMNTQLEKLVSLISKNGLNPVEQFSENWQQHVSTYINEYGIKHNVAVKAMSKEQKAALVTSMYDHGLFNYRDAAAYIASELGVSRTTIYNYLRGQKE